MTALSKGEYADPAEASTAGAVVSHHIRSGAL